MNVPEFMKATANSTIGTITNKTLGTQVPSGEVAGHARIRIGSIGTEAVGAAGESMFFALARALFLNHGQDSSLALALVAWGEEHEPKAVQFIADNVGDMDKVRRGLGGLARAWIKQDEQAFMMHVAEDEPAWQALIPYVERKVIPEWMGWADRYRKFKLDDLDRKVIEWARSEPERERAAIVAAG